MIKERLFEITQKCFKQKEIGVITIAKQLSHGEASYLIFNDKIAINKKVYLSIKGLDFSKFKLSVIFRNESYFFYFFVDFLAFALSLANWVSLFLRDATFFLKDY